MAKQKEKIEIPNWVARIISFVYLIFIGCFIFPIYSTNTGPMNIIILGINGYLVARVFRTLFKQLDVAHIFIITFLCIDVGIGLRFLLEGNLPITTVEFSLLNIITYIVFVPAFFTLCFKLHKPIH